MMLTLFCFPTVEDVDSNLSMSPLLNTMNRNIMDTPKRTISSHTTVDVAPSRSNTTLDEAPSRSNPTSGLNHQHLIDLGVLQRQQNDNQTAHIEILGKLANITDRLQSQQQKEADKSDVAASDDTLLIHLSEIADTTKLHLKTSEDLREKTIVNADTTTNILSKLSELSLEHNTTDSINYTSQLDDIAITAKKFLTTTHQINQKTLDTTSTNQVIIEKLSKICITNDNTLASIQTSQNMIQGQQRDFNESVLQSITNIDRTQNYALDIMRQMTMTQKVTAANLEAHIKTNTAAMESECLHCICWC